MEYSDYETAFADGQPMSEKDVGMGYASHESKRQERKKAKKCRGGPQAKFIGSPLSMLYEENQSSTESTDPDRRMWKKMDPVPAMSTKPSQWSSASYEPFVGEAPALPPKVAGPRKLEGDNTPSDYFGANPNEAVIQKASATREGFTSNMQAPYINTIGDDKSFRLQPDFSTTYLQKGLAKASGKQYTSPSDDEWQTGFSSLQPAASTLPQPFDQDWKSQRSSWYSMLRNKSEDAQTPQQTSILDADKRAILQKLDRIFSRLDDLERSTVENSQTEILLFTMTGLGIIFLMDLAVRAASKMR
jgi:hypothetical protein